MTIVRMRKKSWAGAWHVPNPGSSRTMCKRWMIRAYRTKEVADLRRIRTGDQVCRDCMNLCPELAARAKLVTYTRKVGEAT